MLRALVLMLPLTLAACVEPVPPVAPPLPDADACKASTYQGLIGQPRSVLETMLLPAGTRVIGSGDPVTADFRPERLNIELGATGRIEKIGCF